VHGLQLLYQALLLARKYLYLDVCAKHGTPPTVDAPQWLFLAWTSRDMGLELLDGLNWQQDHIACPKGREAL